MKALCRHRYKAPVSMRLLRPCAALSIVSCLVSLERSALQPAAMGRLPSLAISSFGSFKMSQRFQNSTQALPKEPPLAF